LLEFSRCALFNGVVMNLQHPKGYYLVLHWKTWLGGV
jgi:hypothetical protein